MLKTDIWRLIFGSLVDVTGISEENKFESTIHSARSWHLQKPTDYMTHSKAACSRPGTGSDSDGSTDESSVSDSETPTCNYDISGQHPDLEIM